MATRLYVGNLSYNTSEDNLKNFFAQAGEISSANIITDKMTGRSKGFGFVEMSSDEEATKAIEMFNEKELDGRKIIVNEARPLGEKPARNFNNRRNDNRRQGGFRRNFNSSYDN